MTARRALVRPLFAAFVALGAATAAAQGPVPYVRRYVVDPARSEAGFDGTSTLHDFTGKTKKLGGEVRLDPAHPATTTGGDVWIEAASLDTDNTGRDEEMRKVLETDKFPRIVFSLDGLNGPPAALSGVAQVDGRFSIHGVERRRTFDATFAPVADGFDLRAEIKAKVTDHGMTPPSFLVVSMGDDVKIWAKPGFKAADATAVPSRVVDIESVATIEPLGGAPLTTTRRERLWTGADAAIWEREAEGTAAAFVDGATRRLDQRRALLGAAGKPVDAAFDDAKKALRDLRARLDALPADKRAATETKLKDALARLEQAASLAPAAGDAVVAVEGDRTTVKLGDVVWAEFVGLQGDAPFPALVDAVEGLPGAVRAKLAGIKGTPQSATLRTVSSAGARTLRLKFAAAVDAAAPDWFLKPSSWTKPTDKEIAW